MRKFLFFHAKFARFAKLQKFFKKWSSTLPKFSRRRAEKVQKSAQGHKKARRQGGKKARRQRKKAQGRHAKRHAGNARAYKKARRQARRQAKTNPGRTRAGKKARVGQAKRATKKPLGAFRGACPPKPTHPGR